MNKGGEGKRRGPLGPSEVRVMVDNCLQASMFFRTASSSPERCLCPSLSMPCIPPDLVCNPMILCLEN